MHYSLGTCTLDVHRMPFAIHWPGTEACVQQLAATLRTFSVAGCRASALM
jgi:hypothetical protein